MTRKPSILVAENNMPWAMFMISVLTQAGYDVNPVFTGQKALAVGAERKFDLIIVEADLPVLNGYEICRDLKQRHISWKTPIVIVSANATIEIQQYALDLGAADIIEIPFHAEELKARIFACLTQTLVFNQ